MPAQKNNAPNHTIKKNVKKNSIVKNSEMNLRLDHAMQKFELR